jgi:hypothetical protein
MSEIVHPPQMLERIHPIAKRIPFPQMSLEELTALADDIKANGGLRERITTFEDLILDGFHRFMACGMSGIEPRYEQFNGDEKAALAFVVSKNLVRRHLTAKDKHDAIEALIKACPEMSNRAIAKIVGADHHKIGKVRKKAEDVGKIPHAKTRIDTKGRKQPARRASKASKAKAQPDPRATLDEVRDPGKFKQHELPISDLAEKLRAAEIKILALESEIEELKEQNAELRRCDEEED